jgi:ferritin-like metal-binding protein YciE
MRDLFVRELQNMLGVELRLFDEVLPAMRDRARSADLRIALDRHILETEGHVANLRRAFALLGEPDVGEDGPPLPLPAQEDERDVAMLGTIVRVEHFEVGAYQVLVQLALALRADAEAVHLLRLNMEQDAYALEQAEHALVKLLAEQVEA